MVFRVLRPVVVVVALAAVALAGAQILTNKTVKKTINGDVVTTGTLNASGAGAFLDYSPSNGPPDPDPNDGPSSWMWDQATGKYVNIDEPPNRTTVEFTEIKGSSPQKYNWVVKDSSGNTVDQGTCE